MQLGEARRLIQSEFRIWRDANFPEIAPTAWQNKRFETDGKKEYFRVEVTHQLGTKPWLGNPGARRSGILFIQIFTERYTDMRRSDLISQSVLDFLKHWPNNELAITEPTANEIGPDDAWYQVNVTGQFQYEDFG